MKSSRWHMEEWTVRQQNKLISEAQKTLVIPEEQEPARIVLLPLLRKEVQVRQPSLSHRKARECSTTN